jgi:hypothetical protein
MNFLQLVQSLRQECGVAGTGPTTTVDQVGQAKKLVDWINSAWLEVQGKHDTWGFMREPFSFVVAQGVGDHLPSAVGLSDLRYWHRETLRCYKTPLGFEDEQWLVEWEYQIFRNTYRFNLQRVLQGRPMVFAIRPNGKELLLGPLPDAQYTVVGEYQTLPVRLSGDSDTPSLPEHLHMIIVYKAMEYYGLFESAPEVLSRGKQQYTTLMAQLEREQLEVVYLGNPLA